MWVVVYLANNEEIAYKLQELFEANDVLVRLRTVESGEEGNENYFEVTVPEHEVEKAHEIIIQNGY